MVYGLASCVAYCFCVPLLEGCSVSLWVLRFSAHSLHLRVLSNKCLSANTHTQRVHDCSPPECQKENNLCVGLSVQLAPKHSIPAYASSGVANGTMTSLVFYTFCYVFCCDILQSRKWSQAPETFLCLAVL